MTITQHGILGYAVLMNETFWNSLPVKIQHQLLDAMKETTDWQFEQAALMNEQDMEKLKQLDDFDVYTMSPQERQRFKEQLTPVYDFYRAHIQNDQILAEIEKSLRPNTFVHL